MTFQRYRDVIIKSKMYKNRFYKCWNQQQVKKIIYKLNKKFCMYGVCLDVQIRFEFSDVKLFKH